MEFEEALLRLGSSGFTRLNTTSIRYVARRGFFLSRKAQTVR
jgi:hypothetical protein